MSGNIGARPVVLQDAMSRQAQAEREKQARVILGSAEAAIAGKFVEAAAIYAGHPVALQLRAMNIIYATTKKHGVCGPHIFDRGSRCRRNADVAS
jgi:hypothetical protein